MRFLKWLAAAIGAIVLTLLFLDTFGGYLFDGPLGPIPGGALSGPVNSTEDPDWSKLEKVLELEIRPSKPWSLHIWGVVVDGQLYSPSAYGAKRRWPKVVVEDPRVRLRTNGQIYERRLERVTDRDLEKRIREALVARYGLDPKKAADDDTTWFFHYLRRTPQGADAGKASP
jgi:hypothetical protein